MASGDLTSAAAVIAGLLCADPTPADAREEARAWLRAWEAGSKPAHPAECPCGEGRNPLHVFVCAREGR